MLIRMAVRLVLLAGVIALVAWIVPGIHVEGGALWVLWVALLFTIVNNIVGPLLRLLTLPFIILTLGLFLLIINTALLAFTADLSSHLNIDNFWSAFVGGILIAAFSWLGEVFLGRRESVHQ